MNRSQEYTYIKSKTKDFKEFAKLREKYLKNIFQNIKPKRILELGCGEGSLGKLIKDLTGAQVYGVDYSITGVHLAREKGIIAKQADLNKGIPFEENFFDLLISDQLIEHIYNTDLFLKECHRVLRKHGYLITITPNLSYWLNRMLFLFGIYPIFLEVSTIKKTMGQRFLKKLMKDQDAMGHIRVFNLAALTDMLESQGFVIKSKIGIPVSFNLPLILKVFYNFFDILFAKKTSLARDIMIVAKKSSA